MNTKGCDAPIIGAENGSCLEDTIRREAMQCQAQGMRLGHAVLILQIVTLLCLKSSYEAACGKTNNERKDGKYVVQEE